MIPTSSLSLLLFILHNTLAFDISVPPDPVYPQTPYNVVWSRTSSEPDRFLVQKAIVGVTPNPEEYQEVASGGNLRGTIQMSIPSVAHYQWLILDPNSRAVLWRSRDFSVIPTPPGGVPQNPSPQNPPPDTTTKKPQNPGTPTKSPDDNNTTSPNPNPNPNPSPSPTDQTQTPNETTKGSNNPEQTSNSGSSVSKPTSGSSTDLAGNPNPNPSQTDTAPSSANTTGSASPQSPDSPGPSKPPIGAILGGVLGGLIVFLLAGCWWYRRKRRPAKLRLIPSPAEFDMSPVSTPPGSTAVSGRQYNKAEEARYGYSVAAYPLPPSATGATTTTQATVVALPPLRANHAHSPPSSTSDYASSDAQSMLSSTQTNTTTSSTRNELLSRIAALEASQAQTEEVARLRAENQILRQQQQEGTWALGMDPPPLYAPTQRPADGEGT